MREDVHRLLGERPRPAADGRRPDGPEGEMAVDLHDSPSRGGARHQRVRRHGRAGADGPHRPTSLARVPRSRAAGRASLLRSANGFSTYTCAPASSAASAAATCAAGGVQTCTTSGRASAKSASIEGYACVLLRPRRRPRARRRDRRRRRPRRERRCVAAPEMLRAIWPAPMNATRSVRGFWDVVIVTV